jgi:DUF1680 family protein
MNRVVLSAMPLLAAMSVSAASVKVERVGGWAGGRMKDCFENSVKTADAETFARVFDGKDETRLWQTEFWGKWMHSAPVLAAYAGDEALKAKIASSVEIVLAAQRSDGYLGNYRDDSHLAQWDVWGRKYVMLGLLHQYDATGDRRCLDAAARACDHLMTEVGPGRTPLHSVGNHRGMAAMSVLEPVMRLYSRTKEAKYLDFARYIVAEMDDAADGPALISKALAGIDVGSRWPKPADWWSREQGRKAYEMMSCYQGLLDYAVATGERRILDAVIKSAVNILETEINIAGSGASFECWYHGRERQVQPAFDMMETCVTTTWLRLIGSLLEHTGDVRWADAFERTFYNAYLASLSKDGSLFSKYCPLVGERSPGSYQCGMKVNCCIANGPRGFVALLENLARVDRDGAVCLDIYAPSVFTAETAGGSTRFTVETGYPRDGRILVRVEPERSARFAVKFRIPAWTEGGGRYRVEEREWKRGDTVELVFDMSLRPVEFKNHLAFEKGPLVLARDPRFNDGGIHAPAVPLKGSDGLADISKNLAAVPVDTSWGAFYACTVPLRFGLDLGMKRTQTPRPVGFCDFASAASDWTVDSDCRVWLVYPINEMESEYYSYDPTVGKSN